MVNNTKWSGKSLTDIFNTLGPGVRPDFTPIAGAYYSELPAEGTTELWEIINLTADAHPIHLHLAQFQLVNRQAFNVKGYNLFYDALFPATCTGAHGSPCTVDPMTGLPYPGGVYIGGFGPPADYNTGNAYDAISKTFVGHRSQVLWAAIRRFSHT